MLSRRRQSSHNLPLLLLVPFLSLLLVYPGKCQPQNYFKGDPVAPLPSKALPRIGRRSDLMMMNRGVTDGFGRGRNDESRKGEVAMLPEESVQRVPFSHDQQDFPNVYLLFKRLMNEDPFRPEEPTGIY